MATTRLAVLAFNRGLVSRLALARADVKRVALSAETMINWMPRVLGSMSLRPGWAYIGSTRSDAAAKFVPFVFSIRDTALLELTPLIMRAWIGDVLLTRVSVSSAVTNGNFDADVASWTDNDEAGGTSVWVSGGYMGLTGNGTAAAIRTQTVTVAGADQNKEHALRILINRGPVTLRVGSTVGGDEYISETDLQTGEHSLAFTPTGNFTIRFLSRLKRQVLVDSCNVEAAGTVELTAFWSANDMNLVRGDQSGDVIFVACEGQRQARIERRAARSWSVVRYYTDDGPFMLTNVGPITMTPGALSGNTTLTASAAYFKSTNVGSLMRVTSSGQRVTASITAENQFTNAIQVEGVDAQRVFTVIVDEDAGGAATFTLQRSLTASTGPWADTAPQWTADVTTTHDDGLDNQIAWYRLGVKTGDYVNGTHAVELNYAIGAVDGIARITAFTSATVVSIEVITDFGGTAATDDWAEGEWSDRRGWPSAVAFHEGRLWWGGKDGVWGSVSDAFDSFDDTVEGDSGPVARTIGSGPVDRINWLMSLQRLVLGAEGAEWTARSSSLDEPLTPSNFNLKRGSTQGSGDVPAVLIDTRAMYVQRGGTRVFELAFDTDSYDYTSSQLSALIPEIGSSGIVRMAVQRQVDTRLHCVRGDGKVAVCVFDPIEKVICWLLVDTDGVIEDVVVLPGDEDDEEDQVYYVVRRTINAQTKRYLEKWALESQSIGGTANRLADAHLVYSGAATTTITGLTHLEAKSVIVWGNGKDLGTKTVSGGQITGLSEAVTTACVGLTYTGQWKSGKLLQIGGWGGGMNKRIHGLGLILADVHPQGLEYGPSFTTMDNMPLIEAGAPVDQTASRTAYDESFIEIPGEWNTDSRLCLRGTAPRHVTVLAATIPTEVN